VKIIFFFFLLFLSTVLWAEVVTPYTVYLKEGKRLINLKDNTESILSKGIYAKVLELDVKSRNQFYVYDKTGKAIYLTDAYGMVEIADDIRLLPSLDAQKIYPPKSVFKAENKTASFDTQLSVHLDNLNLGTLNGIYSEEIQNVFSPRYEIRTLYAPELSFHFGLNLNYQSSYWKNDSEEVKLSILSFGPVFQYNIIHDDDIKIKGLMGAETALIYSGTTDKYKDDYSALLFDLGIESEWTTTIGPVSIGAHYRHHELKLKKTSRDSTQFPSTGYSFYSLNSWGASIGYKFEWGL
jgi:hypothetical protein